MLVCAVKWQRFHCEIVGIVDMSESHHLHWSWGDGKTGTSNSSHIQPYWRLWYC